MAIVHQYAVPAAAQFEAMFQGAAPAVAEDARRFDAQIDQRERFHNDELNFNAEVTALQDHLRRQQMAQQGWQYQQGLGLEYDQLASQQDYQQAQLGQQQQNNVSSLGRTMTSQMAQSARAAEGRKFDMFMADREAVLKTLKDPQQLEQAKAQLEAHYGMPWGLPEEMMAQQETAAAEAEMVSLSRLFSDPFNPDQSLASPEELEWIKANVPPEKIPDIAHKREVEARQRAALEQKNASEDAKAGKLNADRENDNLLAKQKFEWEQKTKQLEIEHAKQVKAIELEAKKEEMRLKAYEKFQAAHKTWESSPDVDAEGNAVVSKPVGRGPEPKLADFLPKMAGEKEDDAPDWYKKLPSGARYKHPDGTMRTKK
jgi:hypothetical protein